MDDEKDIPFANFPDPAIEGEFIGKSTRIGTEAETMSSARRKAMEQVANEGRTLLIGMGISGLSARH